MAWYPIIYPGEYELILETESDQIGKALTVTLTSPEIDFKTISVETAPDMRRTPLFAFTVEKKAYYKIAVSSENARLSVFPASCCNLHHLWPDPATADEPVF